MIKGFRARVQMGSAAMLDAKSTTFTNPSESGGSRVLLSSKTSSTAQNELPDVPLHLLSLTYIAGIDITRVLDIISRGLNVTVDDDEDYFNAQLIRTRGWKILVLGMELPESFHRFFTLVALRQAIPAITNTLPDMSIRETLVKKLIHLSKSDERIENRQKAIYLLGQVGVYLGIEPEMLGLIHRIFCDIATQLVQIQVYQRQHKHTSSFDQAKHSMKIYLFNAIGKYLRPLSNAIKQRTTTSSTTLVSPSGEDTGVSDIDVLDLTLYIIYSEFAHGEARMDEQSTQSLESSKQEQLCSFYVLRTLLSILNSQFVATKVLRDGIGAMFQKFVQPLMRSKDARLQMHAVQFVSLWLPITRPDAFVQSYQILMSGLEEMHKLIPSFDLEIYTNDYLDFIRKQRQQEIRLALRTKILRQLIQMPGTWSRLSPAPGFPGFFTDVDSSLLHTRQMLLSLPIHPNSAVTIVRPLVSLPGVPTNTTTVPPVFVDAAWAAQHVDPVSIYDVLERIGKITGLPVGYTYASEPLSAEMKAELMINRDKNMVRRTSRVDKPPPPTTTRIIPQGTSYYPTKQEEKDRRTVPYGFLEGNPYDGNFEAPSSRTMRPISAIYGNTATTAAVNISPWGSQHRQDSEDSDDMDSTEPEYTYQRHPLLWPSKEHSLKTSEVASDFMPGAPVLVDIMEPGTRRLQRLLCRVVSVGKDLNFVSVHTDEQEQGFLSIGAQFNLYIQSRDPNSEWTIVQLEILDNDHDEEIEITPRKTQQTLTSPIPAGQTITGDAYFAPPVNVVPLPAGYDDRGEPYYGRTPLLKPPSTGLTTSGIAYYDAKQPSSSLTKAVNAYAGFDHRGRPIFVPHGCKIPAPNGFTSDGVPYYDLLSMITHRGMLLAPKLEEIRVWIKKFKGTSIMSESDLSQMPVPVRRFLDDCTQSWNLLTGDPSVTIDDNIERMLRNLDGTQIKWQKQPNIATLGGTVADYLEAADRTSLEAYLDITDNATTLIEEPRDPIEFIRQFEDLAYLRPSSMKVAIEPPSVTFQSVFGSLTRSVLLKFRAARGDHEERNVFIAISPIEVFQVKQFHLQLQGEGVLEIAVTFFPTSMKFDKQEGALSLIDDSGRKLATTALLGLRQTFVKVTPLTLNMGWILPHRKKEISFGITNISVAQISLALAVVHAVEDPRNDVSSSLIIPALTTSTEESEQSIIQLATNSCRIQPSETYTVALIVSPKELGRFSEWLAIEAPGKETINVRVYGVCGVPLIVYPEEIDASESGPIGLSRERNLFLKTLLKHENKSSAVVVSDKLSTTDRTILRKFISATNDRTNSQQIDFGLLQPNETRKCCLTIFNMTDESVTVAIVPLHPAIKAEYLLRIAPRSANVTELSLNVGKQDIHGQFQSVVHVVAAHLDAQILGCRAFIGQPLGFPMWRYAYFAPVRSGQRSDFIGVLINQTDYNLQVTSQLTADSAGASDITTSLSINLQEPSIILANATLPVKFTFTPTVAGVRVVHLELCVHSPTRAIVPATLSNHPLTLIGIIVDIAMISQLDTIRPMLINPQRLAESIAAGALSDNTTLQLTTGASPLPSLPPMAATHTMPKSAVMVEPPLRFLTSRQPIEYLVSSQADEIKFADSQKVFRVAQPLSIENISEQSVEASFFSSTFFNIQPRSAIFGSKDVQKFDTMYLQPEAEAQCMVAGFHAGIIGSLPAVVSVSVIARANYGFLVYPMPDRLTNEIILDFGNVETGSASQFQTQKSVLLVNTYSSVMSWTVRLLNAKAKYTPFSCTPQSGELQPYEAFRVPFSVLTGSNGIYEVMAELLIKDTLDRTAKSIKVCRVICRIICLTTMFSGIPDMLDYGSTIIGQTKEKHFTIYNTGSAETYVSIVAKSPFQISPASFLLSSDSSQEVILTLTPYESAVFQHRLLIFCNHTVSVVTLVGISGTADLQCESAENSAIDFGQIHESTIAWADIYMTNCGSLTIGLCMVQSDRPEFLRLEYMGTSSTVPPRKRNWTNDPSKRAYKKNYWAAVRKKLSLLSFLRSFSKEVVLSGQKADRKVIQRTLPILGKAVFINLKGGDMPVQTYSISTSSAPSSVAVPPIVIMPPALGALEVTAASNSLVDTTQRVEDFIPPIRPFHSYHFRVGFTTPYQTKKTADLLFIYAPYVQDQTAQTGEGTKTATLALSGSIFKTLEFTPPIYDFGVAPAEKYLDVEIRQQQQQQQQHMMQLFQMTDRPHDFSRDDNNIGNSKRMILTVVNPGFETHNLTVLSIPTYLVIVKRSWYLSPGEKIEIPVEFHPVMEQTQYRGKIMFEHYHGVSFVQFVGTGASADVLHDSVIDFGSLKHGAKSTQSIKLTNKGMLDTIVKMQISPSSSLYQFMGEDLYDSEISIYSGQSVWVDIQCSCSQLTNTQASMKLKWQRVPHGKWEFAEIPFLVSIGVPMFNFDLFELDFGTTYIHLHKILILTVQNNGNAACHWSTTVDNPCLKASTLSGILAPQSTETISMTFTPISYESLEETITFDTDAGFKSIICYGIVGVPMLHIAEEDSHLDFEIVEIGKSRTKMIVLTNTGACQVEFELVVSDYQRDGETCLTEPVNIFYASISKGFIEPLSKCQVVFSAAPQEYNAVISAAYTITTNDGERYDGTLACVGGKAIIKLSLELPHTTKPPLHTLGTRGSSLVEISEKEELLDSFLETKTANGAPESPVGRVATRLSSNTSEPVSHTIGMIQVLLKAQAETMREIMAEMSSDKSKGLEAEIVDSENQRRTALQRFGSQPGSASTRSRTTTPLPTRLSRTQTPLPIVRQSSTALTNILVIEDEQPSMSSNKGGYATSIRSSSTSISEGSRPSTQRLLSAKGKWLNQLPFSWQDVQRPVSAVIDSSIAMIANLETMIPDSPLTTDVAAMVKLEVLAKIKETIQYVKDQVGFLRSSKVEVLHDAVERLSHFSDELESVLYPGVDTATSQQQEQVPDNRFGLGLIQGGTLVEHITLFCLPNLGNLPFPFAIVSAIDGLTLPSGCPLMPISPFTVSPTTGLVQPNDSVCLYAGFSSATYAGNYSQKYDVQNDGATVLQFTLVADVGNPQLQLNPAKIDFGRISLQKQMTQVVVLTNVGSYPSQFHVTTDPLQQPLPVQLVSSIFNINPVKGTLQILESISFELIFQPTERGEYSQTFLFHWVQAPKQLLVCGTGAAPIYDFSGDIDSEHEMHIEYGICFLNEQQQRTFSVTNNGTAPGEFSIKHSIPQLNVLSLTSNSSIHRLDIGQTLDFSFNLLSTVMCTIESYVEIVSLDGQHFSIYTTAQCGRFEPFLEGTLTIKSLRLDQVDISSVTVVNMGDFPFKLSVDIQPEHLYDIFNIEGVLEEEILLAESKRNITIAVAPRVDGMYRGNIQIICKFLTRRQEFTLPFSFRCFSRPLSIDSDDKIDLGRVTVGESISNIRRISNFGRDAICYRCSIINPKTQLNEAIRNPTTTTGLTSETKSKKGVGSKLANSDVNSKKDEGTTRATGKKKDAAGLLKSNLELVWKLTSPLESTIQSDDTNEVLLVFESDKTAGEDWIEGLLLIEYQEIPTISDWTKLATIPIRAAIGYPLPTFSRDGVDFGFVPVGSNKTTPLVLSNEGTSTMDYTVESPWAYDDAFKLPSDTVTKGQLHPGQQIQFIFMFAPPIQFEFKTEITIKTNFEAKKLSFRGEGCILRLAQAKFPKIIDIDAYYEESFQFQFEIYNDCAFTMDMDAFVSSLVEYNNAITERVMVSYANVMPNYFRVEPSLALAKEEGIPGNTELTSCNLSISGTLRLPVTEAGATDIDVILAGQQFNPSLFMVCSNVDSLVYNIPIVVHSRFRELVWLRDVNEYSKEGAIVVTSLDFGEVPYELATTLTLNLSNQNAYHVPFKITTSSSRFSIEPTNGSVSGGGKKRVVVTMDPIVYQEDDNIPLRVKLDATMSLFVSGQPDPTQSMLIVTLTGILADMVVQPVFEPIVFGNILKESSVNYILTVPNGTSGGMTYEINLDDELKAAMHIDEAELTGRIRAKGRKPVKITFNPQEALQYEGTLTVSTSMGTYPITISGTGVTPSLQIFPDNIPFGVVALQQNAFNTTTVTNTCSCPLRIVLENEVSAFTTQPLELNLEPDQSVDIAVRFEPLVEHEYQTEFAVYVLTSAISSSDNSIPITRTRLSTSLWATGRGGTMHYEWSQQAMPNGIIEFDFGKVRHLELGRAACTMNNTGDTDIKFYFVTGSIDGKPMVNGKEVPGKRGTAAFSINPASGVVHSGQEVNFKLAVLGLAEGIDDIDFYFAVQSQTKPVITSFHATANVSAPREMRAMQSYIKVDASIEDKLDYRQDEERKFRSDEHLWKLLVPIVRLNGKLPSQEEIFNLRYIEPDVTYAGVNALLLRPAAVPRDVKRTHGGNKIQRKAATLEPSGEELEDEEEAIYKMTDGTHRGVARLRYERRKEAAMMVKAVELMVQTTSIRADGRRKWG